ncbi:MAG: LysM peptidoglycan-binding domain-containing protein [Deltaproteobacteria bacterium]|nr:MAG: LysM peptidoglycan-binding domain-containing protein [Deltaproteobacteria bacterium]
MKWKLLPSLGLCWIGIVMMGCVQPSHVKANSTSMRRVTPSGKIAASSSKERARADMERARLAAQRQLQRASSYGNTKYRSGFSQDERLPPLRIMGLDMPRHPSFLRLLHRFRNKDWGVMYIALRRHRLYFRMMVKTFRRYGVPPGLVFLAGVESAFHVRLHSGKTAVGIWQFIPKTGRRYGMKISTWTDDRRNVKKASRAAALYLRDLYKMFGRWELAVAAYNCGERCLQRVLRRCPGMSFWDIRLTPRCRLSRETREHVARVYAELYYWRYPPRNRRMPQPLPPIKYATVRTPGPVFVEDVAKAIGMKPKELYDLNPRLSSWTTPPGERYWLKVPPSLRDDAQRFFRKARRRRVDIWLRSHRVHRKTTLSSLSRRYRVPVALLKKLNHLENNEDLRERKHVVIPLPKRRWRWKKNQLAKLQRYALRVKAFRWMNRPSTRFWETRTYARKRHKRNVRRKIQLAKAKLEKKIAEEKRESRRRRLAYLNRHRRRRRARRRRTRRRKGRVWRQKRRWVADASDHWASRPVRYGTCYRVRKGDSFWRISRRVNVSFRQLRRFNRHVRVLQPGMNIKLGARARCKSRSRYRRRNRCYRVRSGDSLWRISKRHSVSIPNLRRWNRRANRLRPGMVLKLSGSSSCRRRR